MCDYPQHLLPQPDFRIINPLNPDDILCRWTKYPMRDESGKLSALAVEEKRIPSYSTNKLPPSNENDIKIAFNNKDILLAKWVPGEAPFHVSNSDFYIDEAREYFFIQIKEIDGFKGNYPFPFTDNKSDFKLSFIVKVIHDPLKVNYSHCCFEIQYFDEKGNQTSKPSQKSLDKVIIAGIRSKLISIARFSLMEYFIV